MRILFVDDTPAISELFHLWFTLEGHATTVAENGLEALRLLQGSSANRFDVIVLDYHMPDMNGLEVVQELRQNTQWQPVPIILFTGDTQGELERDALALGIARVVHKPLQPGALLDIAAKVVQAQAVRLPQALAGYGH